MNVLRLAAIMLLLSCVFGITKAEPINTDSLLQAQKKEERKIPRMMVGYEFNINDADDLTFSHELDFQWYFLKYMGIGFGVELDTNNSNTSLFLGNDKDPNNDYQYDPDDITKFNFHPMLSFRTPPIWFSKTSSWGVMLRCDPGLVMSLPVNDHIWIDPNEFLIDQGVVPGGSTVKVSNHGGKWLFYRVRTALSFYNEFCMLSVGWSFSNYNINYCRNHMEYRGHKFYHQDGYKHTGTLFFALSVCF